MSEEKLNIVTPEEVISRRANLDKTPDPLYLMEARLNAPYYKMLPGRLNPETLWDITFPAQIEFHGYRGAVDFISNLMRMWLEEDVGKEEAVKQSNAQRQKRFREKNYNPSYGSARDEWKRLIVEKKTWNARQDEKIREAKELMQALK